MLGHNERFDTRLDLTLLTGIGSSYKLGPISSSTKWLSRCNQESFFFIFFFSFHQHNSQSSTAQRIPAFFGTGCQMSACICRWPPKAHVMLLAGESRCRESTKHQLTTVRSLCANVPYKTRGTLELLGPQLAPLFQSAGRCL